MIEEYGTLSEAELLQEIQRQLENHPEIDTTDLELKFEDEQLHIGGSLQTEEELEGLVTILEDYVDSQDYICDVEIVVGVEGDFSDRRLFERGVKKKVEEEKEEEEEEFLEEEGLEDLEEEGLEDVEEDDGAAEEEEDDFEDDKW